MKVITIHHPHSYQKDDFPPLVMALGYFDGVHLGHQKVMNTAISIAKEKNIQSAVMTFDPHPSVVLGHKHKHIEYITPLQEKINLVESLGIDYLFIVRFTSDFAHLLPQEFVDDYLIRLNVQHVVAGFDYSYGRLGKGKMDTMPFHSRHVFTQTTVEKLVNEEDEKVSSSLIREKIANGEVDRIPSLLGRFYRTDGTVVHGDKRGRKIGFPTANIEMNDDFLIPKNGVYAVRMLVNNEWENGVCNIGYKPTFKNPDEFSLTIEVHLFDFDRSIYGEEVVIQWHKRLRAEEKFNGIDELIAQIGMDKEKAIQYFENHHV
ncbi:bifunctional riboflavin kinase/FAD synthetase [Falsibacillus albus]|uniref:Riboflavin biosynthesis protein n=1 Tax=Falsibacillus albus TaxID=2478915 RepID=A0A3L7JYU0_9BACI|nr:bifunctional riboflavin kinase/FAD synthetase [Falsibacillus albus]RLQ95700.1 bifunctional riboflavin kinase/FAD synthetase [Falsibacillus albus]